MNLIARRTDTGEYLMPRSYGVNRWTKDPQDARVFRRKSDLTTAVRSAGPRYRRDIDHSAIPFKAVEVVLALVGPGAA